MAVDDYDHNYGNEMHHVRRDLRDAHGNSQLAKWLSIISMILAAIALVVALSALNKASDAESTANRALQQSTTTKP